MMIIEELVINPEWDIKIEIAAMYRTQIKWLSLGIIVFFIIFWHSKNQTVNFKIM